MFQDETLSGDLKSLYAKAAIAAIRIAWHADRKRSSGTLAEVGSVPSEVRRAVELASEKVGEVEKISDDLGGEELRPFLKSNECADILATLYLVDSSGTNIPAEAEELFVASALHHLGESADGDALRRLFGVLVDGTNAVLASLVSESGFGAVGALANFQAAGLSSRLRGIEELLDSYLVRDVPAAEDVEAFLFAFRALVVSRDGIVQAPSFDRNSRHNIADVYVDARLTTKRDPEPEDATAGREAIFGVHRAVVLGDPGGGKSTLTQRLCADICSGAAEDGARVAYRVLLRDAYSSLGDSPPLIDYLLGLPNSRYQMAGDHRAEVLHTLRTGTALVVFDGLDEILDLGTRARAVADIESIAAQYSSVPVLVTSRKIGYELSPFHADLFTELFLAPFSSSDVREYVSKWIRAEGATGSHAIPSIVEDFMEQSEEVRDLRSNPLLLGLMCNLFRGENSIPSNRPEIYEKCAVMLFERWDSRRSIYEPLSFASQLRPTMQRLAEWIYFDPVRTQGVPEREIREKATAVLMERRFSDPDAARAAADEFVDLCKGRAWVFTNTGTADHGEELFQFTHRTFLEYFTAEWLVGTHPTPQELAQRLWPMIRDREGSVVSQLAIQVQNGRSPSSVDECLQTLSDLAEESVGSSGDEAVAVLTFSLETLKYVVPAPLLSRALARRYLDLLVSEYSPVGPEKDPFSGSSDYREILIDESTNALFTCGPEVVEEVIDEFNDWAREEGAPSERIAVAYRLAIALAEGERIGKVSDKWPPVFASIEDDFEDELTAWSHTDFEIAFQRVYDGRLDVAEFADTWGALGLLADVHYSLSPDTGRIPLLSHAAYSAVDDLAGFAVPFQDAALEEFGRRVVEGEKVPRDMTTEPFSGRRLVDLSEITTSSEAATFGMFCALGLTSEMNHDYFSQVDPGPTAPTHKWEQLRWLVAGRGKYVSQRIEIADALFEQDDRRAFARSWLSESVDISDESL